MSGLSRRPGSSGPGARRPGARRARSGRAAAALGSALGLLLLAGLGLAAPAAAAQDGTASDEDAAPDDEVGVVDDGSIAATGEDGVLTYPGNPATEPALVADEEERLSQVRTVASMIRWRGLDVSGPFRLSTGSTYTLVLTKRAAPYGLADLLQLAPQTFVREPDGAYLLTENLVIQPGATLTLAGAGPLTVRLASDAARFVSIVNLGGELVTLGTSAAPVTITSWDRDAGAPDIATEDGRAYVRSIGGQVDLEGTTFSDLGFWSGRTGGVALTGADLPSEGMLDEYGRELRDAVNGTTDPAASTQPAAGETGTGTEAVADTGTDTATVEELVAEGTDTPTGQLIEGLLPAGVLPVPEDLEDPSYSYVSARIEECVFTGNAFGLFVSGANGVDISGSTVENSLVDGLVLHRFVVNAAISGTVAKNNNGDGVILARATTGIVLSEVEAIGNRGSGIVVRGNPLADGPNATGMPVGDYGNNSITNSIASDNRRYGIEIVGGRNVNVNANDVDRNDMGIVVRDDATDVVVVGNRVNENVRHGIALRDGVQGAVVSGNVVSGSPDGVYLRDSAGSIERNTTTRLTSHAVTLVGDTSGTVIEENTFAGRGPSAIDRKRSEGSTVGNNDTDGWESTKPFWTVVRNALQPLTVMWVLLGLLVVGTAIKGSRSRTGRRDPYQAQRRLSELIEDPPQFATPEDPRVLVEAGVGGRDDRGAPQ